MLAKLLKGIIWAFRPHKHGYSIKGFWGQTKHFNKDGIQTGYTICGFLGQKKRYDMDHNLISVSWRNFWGGYNTFDANSNLIKRSRRNFFGGLTTYDNNGKEVMRTYEAMRDDFDRMDVDDCDIMVHIESEKSHSNAPYHISGTDNTKFNAYGKTKNSSGSGLSRVNVDARDISKNKVKNPDKKTADAVEVKSEKYKSNGSGTKKYQSENVVSESTMNETAKVLPKLDELNVQKIDKTVVYESIDEYIRLEEENSVKILVFSYGNMKEFPAYTKLDGERVVVCPLLKGAKEFSFNKKEIAAAEKKVIKGLDMSVVDNEFVTLGASSLLNQFEELFPVYEFGADGMERAQYELKCGLIMTENSWISLSKSLA